MNHTELLNHLAAKHNLKSYLEIGVQNPANNFNKIKAVEKFAVDPCLKEKYPNACRPNSDPIFYFPQSSDEFFSHALKVSENHKFDLIFIDGLHHADQVKRDFENSLRCLNDGGFIVLHDCLPEDEITTCVPRGDQKMWHGDVYKFVMTLHSYEFIDFITYNFDNGCCVVWKDDSKEGDMMSRDPYSYSWEDYKKLRVVFMNIKEWQKELV